MADIHPKLKQTIQLYFTVKGQIESIESQSALSAIHLQYIDNVRHTLDHIMAGLRAEQDPARAGEAEQFYTDAYVHLSNLGPDSYEYIAGVMLSKLKSRIEDAGFFGEVGKALNLRRTAADYYTRGRELRTTDRARSMEQFDKCVSTCQDAMLEIKFPTRKEIIKWWLALIGGGGIVGILVVILKILKVL